MFTFNGEKHGLRDRSNMKYWTVHMDEFFDHFLLGKPRPEWMDKGVTYQDRGKRDVTPLFKKSRHVHLDAAAGAALNARARVGARGPRVDPGGDRAGPKGQRGGEDRFPRPHRGGTAGHRSESPTSSRSRSTASRDRSSRSASSTPRRPIRQPADRHCRLPTRPTRSARNGRVIHVLVDDDSIAPGRESQVREAMRLLMSEMTPGDQLGVLTTQGQINFRPSTDLERVQRVVSTLVGRGGLTETDAEAQCRTTRVLSALGSMLALTGGTPTTIVVFSAGLTPPAQKIIDMTRRASPTAAQVAAASNDTCPDQARRLRERRHARRGGAGGPLSLSRDRGQARPIVEPGRGLREPCRRHRRGIHPAVVEPAGRRLAAAARDRVVLHGQLRAGRLVKKTAAPSASSSRPRATRSGCGRGRRSTSTRTSPRRRTSPKDMLRTQIGVRRPAAARGRAIRRERRAVTRSRSSRCSKRSMPRPRSRTPASGSSTRRTRSRNSGRRSRRISTGGR